MSVTTIPYVSLYACVYQFFYNFCSLTDCMWGHLSGGQCDDTDQRGQQKRHSGWRQPRQNSGPNTLALGEASSEH